MIDERLELLAERQIDADNVVRLYYSANIPETEPKWCISDGKEDLYYFTRYACLAFAYGRGWIGSSDVKTDRENLNDEESPAWTEYKTWQMVEHENHAYDVKFRRFVCDSYKKYGV